jgi:hypothetical protein
MLHSALPFLSDATRAKRISIGASGTHKILDADMRRRSGLIINLADNCQISFGKAESEAEWIDIPAFANIDIPFCFVGEIYVRGKANLHILEFGKS